MFLCLQAKKMSNLNEGTILLNFPDAIREVLNHKKLTRVAWDNEYTYIFLNGEYLSLHMNGQDHQLITCLGDMEAIDWYVLPVVMPPEN